MGFTPKVIWSIVKERRPIAVSRESRPMICDERARSCATKPVANWSRSPGHVSVQTTERYLGTKQRFRNAVNDHIGLEPGSP